MNIRRYMLGLFIPAIARTHTKRHELSLIPDGGAYGSVILLDWWTLPDGRKVNALTGRLTILPAAEFGVTVHAGTDRATWAVIVKGPTETAVVLGCQIRGAHLHGKGRTIAGDTGIIA